MNAVKVGDSWVSQAALNYAKTKVYESKTEDTKDSAKTEEEQK